MSDLSLAERELESLVTAILALARQQRAALEQNDVALLSEVSRQRDDLFRQLEAALVTVQSTAPRVGAEDGVPTADETNLRRERVSLMAREIASIDGDSRRLAEEAMRRSGSEMARLHRARLALNYKRWSRPSRTPGIDVVR